MKNILFLIVTILLLGSCSLQDNQTILTRNHKSAYQIAVSATADSLTQLAAQELKLYIYKVSGADLEITSSPKDDKKTIAVGKGLIKEPSIKAGIDTMKEDGFIIKTIDNNIFISGNNGKANLYATYTFIEEYLGCRLLSGNEEYIPDNPIIVIPEINKAYNPAFSFRRTLFPGVYDEKYRNWHKIESLDAWGSFVHTFNKLISPEQYFETHPEYFSLIGKHRISDGQLCLSNPAVISTLIENLRKEINGQPEKKYWSVSQNDCYNYCQCTDCNAMYKKYGSISGAYVFMANEIAKEFPKKQISTLAYQFTRSAPKNIIPYENVNIMFCSIECNRSMPLAEDKRSRGFVKDMKDWSDLSNNIFVWDYVVQFKNYLTPFPNFQVLQPNILFFSKNNVDMMFEQGSGGSWSDLSELKQYLISKLMWDPYINADSIVNDFMEKYYGPAKPHIKSYYDLTHEALYLNREKEFLNIYGYPSNYFDSYLTPELLKQYKMIMDKAEESVKGDSVYLNRVLRARLPVDFAYLDIALNKNLDEISYLEKSDGHNSIRPDMLEYLDRFVEHSKQTGAARINERSFMTEDYRRYALHKLEQITKKNLARGKTIKSFTEHSELYPVGGESALIDGLFGDLDFHNNWLGFQGNDMFVEIDLGKEEKIHQVSMNFLKAVNSWVFLPVEVIVEISKDGRVYKKAGSLNGDIKDKNYLVKSVPFTIGFNAEEVRYIRVRAISLKQCPEWHRGFGNPSWIFIDELIVD
jgi:hypothetical protein